MQAVDPIDAWVISSPEAGTLLGSVPALGGKISQAVEFHNFVDIIKIPNPSPNPSPF